ncbi:amidohydrolase family protein [Brachybacterium sp. p3-SID1565]|uniref:Amidohydrolase family protein n=1 Tax=Brachybacterium epidermidis TaxID=2781983 RepID=A0ABR9W1I2_9MICO|nr:MULTISPECIES: amidohydrolase family protein [Brachybacterium]MBE9404296.1 amidohydrolase family protein [Brachybacterium epidermidis]MCT1384379.1 amidohydrolase family protein [Brachybacterium sp. p3-SID1565]
MSAEGPGTGTPAPGHRPGRAITDAHLHLWDLEASAYAWTHRAPALQRTGAWEQVGPALAALGATRVVLVHADDTPGDTAHMQRTAERIEAGTAQVPAMRADVVAWLPLENPAQVEHLLGDAAFMQRVVGVRHLVHDEPDAGFLERPAVADSLHLVSRAGLALDVPDAFARHMDQVVRLAHAHPELTLVLDHLGKPPLGDAPAMDRWRAALARIAACERTVAKVSGLATSGDGALEQAVDVALEQFGPARLMFGSDWPIAPTPFDLGSGTSGLLERLGQESEADQRQILHGTAARVYTRAGQARG